MSHEAGQYYHIYNRGANRKRIFASDDNYRYLLAQAKKFLAASLISIIAYCLMPNHYYFLLYAGSDDAIGRFIQRLFNSYTQAFNREQNRSGTLFEGRAKSILVDDEAYAIHLCRYIHLNPVAAHLVARPEDWPYSNYLEWIGKRSGTLIDHAFVKEYFPQPNGYEQFIMATADEALMMKVQKYYFD
jgi:REP element-mobilizing transposase RayT